MAPAPRIRTGARDRTPPRIPRAARVLTLPAAGTAVAEVIQVVDTVDEAV